MSYPRQLVPLRSPKARMADPEPPNLSREAQTDAIIEEEVARAMAPYRALDLPAEVLEELEQTLRFALRHHPGAKRLVRQLVSDPVMVQSDAVDTSGVE